MKPKNPSVRSVAFVLFVLSPPALFGGDITWNGGGGDNNWNTPLNWGGVVPMANDALFFGGTARLTNTNNLTADTSFSGITFNSGASAFTIGGNRINLGGGITNNSASLQTINLNMILDSTRSITPGAGGTRLGGVISGNGGLSNIAAGSLTLNGSGSNTYVGLTGIEAGRLILGKTGGATAVSGNLSLTGNGSLVTFAASGSQNQIADTSAVTINGAGAVFNGLDAGTSATSVTETIGAITVNDGYFNTGTSTWTITGAGVFDGTNGDTRFIGNSGSQTSFGSLSLTAMTGTTIVSSPDGFVVGGNNATKSTLTVGTGGLSLDGSSLGLGRGIAGSRLVLDGNVTVTGNSLSTILAATGTGVTDLELSSTSGSHTRTFNVGGTSELNVTAQITNGAATEAGIMKTGTGILRLSGTGTYTGNATVSQGTLSVTSAASLPGFDTAGRYSVASGATLAFGNSVTTAEVTAMLGTGNFAAGSSIGIDTSAASRTFDSVITNTANSLNFAKIGANTARLTGDSTYTGVTRIQQGILQLGSNTSTGSIASSSGIEISAGAILQTSRLSGTTFTISQAISGEGGVTTTNAGTTVLAGAASNTYTGTTTAGSATRLTLGKTGGATAVGGDLNISGAVLFLNTGVQNQIVDTSIVTIGSLATLNGTGSNASAVSLTETIGGLVVNGGFFNTGNGSKWTVTGAATFNGGVFTGNSGSSGGVTTFGGLSLNGMNGAGAITTTNTFGIGGGNLTAVVVGSGGLSLNNSSVKLSTGTSGNGSRIILDGNVTTTGTAATGISVFSGDGSNARVELSSTSGTHNRTFTVGADAPMAISVAVNKGSATTAGIIKDGAGILTLGAANNYNGSTVVNGGTLRVAGAINSSTALSATNARLQLGVSNVLADAATLSLNNATFDSGGYSETLGVLTIAGDNVLDLGNLASVMHFANSSSATWGSTISILNWSGSVTGGGTDQVYFGSNTSGLTVSQVSSVTFLNPEGYGAGTYAATFLANGELVPMVPELSGLFLSGIGAVALMLRRKRCA